MGSSTPLSVLDSGMKLQVKMTITLLLVSLGTAATVRAVAYGFLRKNSTVLKGRHMRTATPLIIICMLSILFLIGCMEKGQEKKVHHVATLTAGAFSRTTDGFKARMTELGYIEGKNIVYHSHYVESDFDEMKRIAKEIVSKKVDLIFTTPTEPSQAAQAAAKETDIPIVFAYAGIEDSGLVKNVRQPGGHITGVRFPGPEQTSKRLEILLEILPSAKHVWIGYDKNYPTAPTALEALRPLALARGITLAEVPAESIGEIEADLATRAALPDMDIDAMMLMPDIFNHCPRGWGIISKIAAENKVPVAGTFRYTVAQGAVFGNANDLVRVGELAAPSADKILKGTPAGTIPVITPEQSVWINYRVAQELGLTVPDGVLAMAAEIIR